MVKRLISAIAWGKPVLIIAALGVLLGSSLGAAYAMGLYPSSTSWSKGLINMNSEEASDLKRAFDEQQATWGFVSQHGRAGRITSIDDEEKILEVETPKGVITVAVEDTTRIYQAQSRNTEDVETLDFDDLSVGSLVIVDGETGTEEGVAAKEIEVVKEGSEGYNIQPAKGGEDVRMVPLFP